MKDTSVELQSLQQTLNLSQQRAESLQVELQQSRLAATEAEGKLVCSSSLHAFLFIHTSVIRVMQFKVHSISTAMLLQPVNVNPVLQ